MRVIAHLTCSKSRAALDALEARGYAPEVLEYQKPSVLSRALLEEVEQRLGVSLRTILRTKEAGGDLVAELSDEDLYEHVISHPALLERPIVLAAGVALVARPPREVWELVPEVYLTSREDDEFPQALTIVQEPGDAETGPWIVVTADNIPIGARCGTRVRLAPGWEDLGIERLLKQLA